MAESHTGGMLLDCGFHIIDVFDRERLQPLLESLSKLLGPTQEQARVTNVISLTEGGIVTSSPARHAWRVSPDRLEGLLVQDAERFQIKIMDCLPYYKEVFFYFVDDPSIPFLLLICRVIVNTEKVQPAMANQTLRRIVMPFRLLMEKFEGMSAQLRPNMSPRVPYVTWVGVHIEGGQLNALNEKLHTLESLRNRGALLAAEDSNLLKEVQSYQRFDLTDAAVPISSYIPAYHNLTLVLGQTEQPGIGSFRTPFLMYLTTEENAFKFPEEFRFTTGFPWGFGIDNLAFNSEEILTWLICFHVWSFSRLNLAQRLDQDGVSLRKSATVDKPLEPRVEDILSRASELGTKVATTMGEVGSLRRRLDAPLKGFISNPSPFLREISVLGNRFAVSMWPFLIDRGTLGTIAGMILDALGAADSTFRAVEHDLSAFQRHISDLVNLKTAKSNLELSSRISRLNRILVAITIALLFLTVIQAIDPLLRLLHSLIP